MMAGASLLTHQPHTAAVAVVIMKRTNEDINIGNKKRRVGVAELLPNEVWLPTMIAESLFLRNGYCEGKFHRRRRVPFAIRKLGH